jgi:hypothetical protein
MQVRPASMASGTNRGSPAATALYDRAIPKVRISGEHKLKDMAGELSKIYRAMNVKVRKPKAR